MFKCLTYFLLIPFIICCQENIWNTFVNNPEKKEYLACQQQIIIFLESDDFNGADSITTNEKCGAQLVANHLIELGHRR